MKLCVFAINEIVLNTRTRKPKAESRNNPA